MHNFDVARFSGQPEPALEVYSKDGIGPEAMPNRVDKKGHLFKEVLASGAEVIIEVPPILTRYSASHNSQNTISTPLFQLENQTHIQAKQLSATGAEQREFKDGTGDFCFFIHIRKPGLYSLSFNCMFDGLSAITDGLWQAKLAVWKKTNLEVNGQAIDLKLPDVAFSELMRQFFSSYWCQSWLKTLDNEITSSLTNELKNKNPRQPEDEKDYEIGEKFGHTSAVMTEQLENLIFMMGRFRAMSLYGHEESQNGLPFDQKSDAWYLNSIFGITTNLVVEPFTIFQPFNPISNDPQYSVEKLRVITHNFRSRADIVAHTGSDWELSHESAALDAIKQETWLSDGNAQTDNLIYQLQKVSQVINQVTNLLSKVTGGKWLGLIQEVIGLLSQLKKTEAEFETELLLKPWIAYAVLPPEWSPEYLQALRATTHTSSKVHTISHSDLVSITATDGATTTTRDATKRRVTSLFGDETAKAIQQLVSNAVGLTPQKLSEWLDKTLHTADDRSVQDQKISKKGFLSGVEFDRLVKAAKKFLPDFEPTVLQSDKQQGSGDEYA